MTTKPRRVRIYPVPGVSLYPWRAIEQEVSEAEWELLKHSHPQAFTDKPPKRGKKADDIGGTD